MTTVREQIMSGNKPADNKEDEYEFGDATFKQQLDLVKSIEEPKDAASAISQMLKMRSVTLAPEDEEFYNTRMQEFGKRAERAQELYESNRSATEWAQIGEMFGHALVKYAAAREGLKRGVDITTGLKQDKVDWQRMLDRIDKDLDRELSKIDKGETLLERRKNALVNRAARERDTATSLKVREAASREAATERDARKQEVATKELAKKQDKILNQAQSNISKMSNTRTQLVANIKNYEQQLEKGLIDEDKFKLKVMDEITKRYSQSGFKQPAEIDKMLELSQDPDMWDSFVGILPFTDKPKPGIPVSQQLVDIPTIDWDDDTKSILNNYLKTQDRDTLQGLQQLGILGK